MTAVLRPGKEALTKKYKTRCCRVQSLQRSYRRPIITKTSRMTSIYKWAPAFRNMIITVFINQKPLQFQIRWQKNLKSCSKLMIPYHQRTQWTKMKMVVTWGTMTKKMDSGQSKPWETRKISFLRKIRVLVLGSKIKRMMIKITKSTMIILDSRWSRGQSI